MRPGAFVALCSILGTATRVEAQAGGQAGPDRFAEARALIQQLMAKEAVPGLTIAVTRGDSLLWEEGFGWADLERRVPATPATPFYLASLTKTITATAAVRLQERGLLMLDRPANDYLGRAGLWSPAWDPTAATVRRLANHTSGLTTFDIGCRSDAPSCAEPEVSERIRKYGVLVWPPGLRFDYSNLGYEVLGEVAARAGGRDLSALLRDEVFGPLGMRRSSLGIDPAHARETAQQYNLDGNGRPIPKAVISTHPSGASTAYASAHDLALFGMFHMKVHPRGQDAILPDATLDSMQLSTVPASGGSRYGIGWWVEENRFGYRSVLAQGANDASTAWLRLIPQEQIGVAVLANRSVGFPSEVIDAVIAALLPRYEQERSSQRLRAAAAQPAPPAPPAPMRLDSALVGTWRGAVLTPEGEVPLTFAVADTGVVDATVGAEARAIVGRARQGATLFIVTLPGSLDATDENPQDRLDFYFLRRPEGLMGNVNTRPPSRSGLGGRVSHWVALRKGP